MSSHPRISRVASCALRMLAARCSRRGQTALFSGILLVDAAGCERVAKHSAVVSFTMLELLVVRPERSKVCLYFGLGRQLATEILPVSNDLENATWHYEPTSAVAPVFPRSCVAGMCITSGNLCRFARAIAMVLVGLGSNDRRH